MHNTTDNAQMDKAAQTISRTTQNSDHTAMDYALKTQEMNTRLLQQTSQAWIDGFRYRVKLSQGMAQVFFEQWGNALASMTPVALPVERQSGSEVTEEPATNGVQKVSEPAAKDAQKDIELAEKAEKKAEKKAETQQAEKVARETRKAEEAAEETQKKTEIAAESAQKSAEPAAEETQKSTEVAAKDAQETQKSTETATFPIDGYDEMNVGEVSERLNGLSVDELKRVRKYEKSNKDRGSLRKEMKQKIQTTS